MNAPQDKPTDFAVFGVGNRNVITHKQNLLVSGWLYNFRRVRTSSGSGLRYAQTGHANTQRL